MKKLFKDLQKSHMKQVKADSKRQASGTSRPLSKGFILDCLVRVELEEKWEESHRKGLKVSTSSMGIVLEYCIGTL